MPVIAVYLSHNARTPLSVSGPRSPTNTLAGLNWRSGLQVGSQCTTSGQWQWHRPLLVPLAQPEDDGAAPLREHQVVEFEGDEITDTATRVEKQGEDRSGSGVLPQFNFPQ